MAEVQDSIEVLENRLMRAWLHQSAGEIRNLVQADCLMMFGTAPPVLLDRPSFIAGLERGLRCDAFRFHEVTARAYGKTAWFTGHAELDLSIGARRWTGNFLITDLWRKGTVRRRWKLAERSIAPAENNSQLSDAILALQLWR
ncbi:hypothetical protein CD351_09140 [Erythrobacter sp. KY5]|uniref:nuclear transport factor 2 family protein n=1 Tax=Erythrobacter sp. KY5 TaxID=2011159 RepID=UPI000DBEFDE1|nr:nuclear transport factor 2 family protein [Erythrobacter sp. KY5]AWW74587.1 hypothetical protein CD351_09140 [Erythrobacter sp. KY5]